MAKLNIITLGSSKNYTDLAALGLTNVVVNDQDKTISFTLVADGSTRTLHFDQPSDGKDGSDGIGISKIEKIGTVDLVDTYRITFTDNSTFDYEVKNGKDGADGYTPVKGTDYFDGQDGFSPIIEENENNTDNIYKLDVTTADGTFTTPNLKGKDGSGSSTGEENVIESIKVNGVAQTVADDKSVDITVPTVDVDKNYVDTELAKKANSSDIPSLDGYAKTSEIPKKVSQLENDSNYLSSIPEEYVTETELSSKGYLTEHQDISGKVDKVEGKSLISDTEIARLATVDNYDDTEIRTELAKKADAKSIPSKVSELTNDSNYQTAEQVNSTVTTEIAKVVADAPEDLNTLKEMSDWIAGHEDDASAMNSAISDNKTAITALQTDKANKTEIPTTVAELTDSADYAKTSDVNASIKTLQTDKANTSDLTAHTGDSVIHVTAENKTLWNTVSNKVNKEDGKALLADTDKTNYDDAVTKAHTHENKEVLYGITSDKVTAWDNKSDFSGSYNDLNDKPTIDAELSNTSENAIQNKVVTKEINKLYSDISFNDFDTATSGISFTDAEDGNMLVTNATRNLLNPTLQTTTQNGVTCTNNGDGTYTLNGTATKAVTLYIAGSPTKNTVGGYKLLGCPINGSVDTYRIVVSYYDNSEWRAEGSDIGNGVIIDGTYSRLNYLIKVESGTTLTNLVFKPMLTTDLNATYDDFVPYGGYEIKSCGKNLMNLTKITTNNTGTTASLSNGIITLDGSVDTSGGWKDIYFGTPEQCVSLKRGVKYTISTKDKVQKVFILLRKATGLKVLYTHDCYTNGTTFVASEDMVCQVTVTFKESSTFNNTQLVPQIEVGEKATEYEPYQDGGSVHIDSSTEFPLLGLKTFDGVTNIISPGNVKCVYPTNESGKGVLDSLYNKDKMLTEQNKSLSVIGKCKNLLNPTFDTETNNGITFTRNDDGTYSLSGSRTDTSISAYTTFIDNLPLEKGKYKLTGALDENNYIRCIVKVLDSANINIYDYGNGVVLDVNETDTTITLLIVSTDDTSKTRIIKPMLTTDISSTYDDFVPYTGDGETLASDVAEIKKDLGGLTFSASGTTLTITDGTNTWTLGANS